uniref:Uncharacterized protein n=1 Tax=Anguilla anguilla TaxID=7936 RepID=A0A0E9QYK8_ANGAN
MIPIALTTVTGHRNTRFTQQEQADKPKSKPTN